MKFIIQRETLLKPLQSVISIAEKRQTMPILANILLEITDNKLSMTSTDLEIELVSDISLEATKQNFDRITVPARKLLDICRVLPEKAMLDFYQDNDNCIVVRSGKGRFVLAALPANGFPNIEWNAQSNVIEFTVPQKELSYLIETTHFAMAQQDARYYLNGLLLEIKDSMIWAVAADGHRMAINGIESSIVNNSSMRVIVPRKGIIELIRLLEDSDEEVKIAVSDNHIRVIRSGLIFTSKLIDGKYPDYERMIPRGGDKKVIIEHDAFKQALAHVAILSNDMFCGVQLQIRSGLLHMLTRSQEREQAEEEIAIDYQGEDMTIGFNINYLFDILANVRSEKIIMTLKNNTNGILLEEFEKIERKRNNLYVIMPLRL